MRLLLKHKAVAKSESQALAAAAATAASSIYVLSLQKYQHDLARCAPSDPCPAITVGGLVCRRLIWPYTSGPLFKKSVTQYVACIGGHLANKSLAEGGAHAQQW